ncbi:hypothetical protein Tco_1510866, partial [Tanacetum coccineum]
MESPIFYNYIAACEREQLDDFNFEEAWIELGIGKYQVSLTKSILITDPYLRLIHRMITYSINGRGNGHERISMRDLWLLYQVSDPSRYTDIPYSLALFLQETSGLRDTPSIVRDTSRSTTVWGDDREVYNEEEFQTTQVWEDDRNMYHEETLLQLPQPPQLRQKKRARTVGTEWDYQVNFNDLSLRIDRLQESMNMMQEMQRRCMYDLYRIMQQHYLDNQTVTSWFDPSVPPPYNPPFGQVPQWDPQHPNPPHPTPYDQWIRRPRYNN